MLDCFIDTPIYSLTLIRSFLTPPIAKAHNLLSYKNECIMLYSWNSFVLRFLWQYLIILRK